MATKIDYAAVLADLKARRDALGAAISASAIEALAPASREPALGRPPKAPRKPRPGDLDFEDTSGGPQ